MKKKSLLLMLSLLLATTLTLGGTLAYLTDTDADINTFTFGNVDITLNEEFEQGSELIPGKDIQKEVTITNTGSNEAWVWYTLAVPKALDNPDASLNVVHTNVPGRFWDDYRENQAYWADGQTEAVPENKTWDVDAPVFAGAVNPTTMTIDGIEYTVYAHLYNGSLLPGETTNMGLSKVYLDDHIDIDPEGNLRHVEGGVVTDIDWNIYEQGNPKILVNAFAIQKEGFDTVEAAFAAFMKQWTPDGVNMTEDLLNAGLLSGTTVEISAGDTLREAVKNAKDGDVIKLTEDVTVAGYAATNKLVIDKPIVLDLNGFTLTTECGWGGIDAKNGCTIKNGTIHHTGNTAAIKAFQLKSIENVDIIVDETAGKVKGGIVVQEGAGCYIGSIKDVTITGATNGIETYRCGAREGLAIGSLSNVTIDATDTGFMLSAPVGTATNCVFEGDNIGINMYLYGPYSVSIDLVNSTVDGATGIYAHDEAGVTNPGSLTLTYDDATVINGGLTEEFESEAVARVNISEK